MGSQWRLVAVCCLVAVAPVFVRAQQDPAPPSDPPPPVAAATGQDGQPAEEEKPALLQYDPGAAVWTIVVFVGLLIVLRAFAWKPILRVLNEREQFIEKSIADAKGEREQAAKLLAEYQVQLERARAEAAGVVEQGRRDGDVVRQRIQQEARQQAEEALARARREIQLAADAAVKDLYDRTADLAVDLAGRIVRQELSPEKHRQLIADSIAQIKRGGESGLN